jgi:cob(I)alamin adenosyltransferase
MKIYTKTGDAGETGLFGGERLSKADARVEAYGSVDETNALIGVARASGLSARLDAWLERIQGQLFVVGAELATPASYRDRLGMPLVDGAAIEELESEIDELEAELSPLKTFVLPAGAPGACALHHARATCRRAERRVIAVLTLASVRSELIAYLNRLADLLFVMARHHNHEAGVGDVPWAPRSGR